MGLADQSAHTSTFGEGGKISILVVFILSEVKTTFAINARVWKLAETATINKTFELSRFFDPVENLNGNLKYNRPHEQEVFPAKIPFTRRENM